MNYKLLIRYILSFFFGFYLAVIGFSYTTVEFWMIQGFTIALMLTGGSWE